MAEYPGTVHHQALLKSIVDFYQDDPRVRAVIVFGSLGRGNWDEYSDIDLDVIVHDGIQVDISNELEQLCAGLAGSDERAAIIIPGGDEGDIVMESLMQLSIRYHPLAGTSPNIIDSMLVLAGSLEEGQISAAGNENRRDDMPPLSQLLDRCVRYAVVTRVEFQRRHFWAASEVLHRMRSLAMDIYARTHGGYRGYHFFDIQAEERIKQRLGAALPAFDEHSFRDAFMSMLDIIENDLRALSGGQLALTPAHKLILERVRQGVENKHSPDKDI